MEKETMRWKLKMALEKARLNQIQLAKDSSTSVIKRLAITLYL